jgi:mRNA interferase MazF
MIRGEIWWADFGIPLGGEAGFRRPVFIVQKESKLGEDSVIIVAQFYALDRQKFIERISKVKRETTELFNNFSC